MNVKKEIVSVLLETKRQWITIKQHQCAHTHRKEYHLIARFYNILYPLLRSVGIYEE